MYQLIDRPAKRMERSLPAGNLSSLSFILASENHVMVSHYHNVIPSIFGCVLLPYYIIRILKNLVRNSVIRFHYQQNNILRELTNSYIRSTYLIKGFIIQGSFRLYFLTLINLGADPILMSAKRWHGCHHSNQGGKIQCQ